MTCQNLYCIGHLEPAMDLPVGHANPSIHRCAKCGELYEVEITVKKIAGARLSSALMQNIILGDVRKESEEMVHESRKNKP
jgi:hypothetical protein